MSLAFFLALSMIGLVATSASGQVATSTSVPRVAKKLSFNIAKQVQPYWNACKVYGTEAEKLVTIVKFRLNENGSLDNITSITTSGLSEVNENQVERHQECAKKAVAYASPFKNLPPKYYSYWQNYEFKFQKR